MAKPSWVTLNKTSGTGNSTFTASSAVYTGRVSRTGSLLIKSTKDATKSATVSVAQTAKPEFLTEQTSSVPVPATGGTVTFVLNSNSKYIFVTKSATVAPKVECYLADGTSQTIMPTAISDTLFYVTIPGDAGASAQYKIHVVFAVPANETISTKTFKLTVGGGSSGTTAMPSTNKVDLTATQAAKVVTLSASPTSITIPAAGTAQTVTITSNDAWTIS